MKREVNVNEYQFEKAVARMVQGDKRFMKIMWDIFTGLSMKCCKVKKMQKT